MNKAFVKEAEDPGDRCPVCGSPGQRVFRPTLEAHLPPELLAEISETAFFCSQPNCRIAYFDSLERSVTADRLNGPVYPKDPDAPICACFGLTLEDVEADVREGGVTRVKGHLQRAKSDEARCSVLAANGQSCIPAVQRCYMQLRGGTL